MDGNVVKRLGFSAISPATEDSAFDSPGPNWTPNSTRETSPNCGSAEREFAANFEPNNNDSALNGLRSNADQHMEKEKMPSAKVFGNFRLLRFGDYDFFEKNSLVS